LFPLTMGPLMECHWWGKENVEVQILEDDFIFARTEWQEE